MGWQPKHGVERKIESVLCMSQWELYNISPHAAVCLHGTEGGCVCVCRRREMVKWFWFLKNCKSDLKKKYLRFFCFVLLIVLFWTPLIGMDKNIWKKNIFFVFCRRKKHQLGPTERQSENQTGLSGFLQQGKEQFNKMWVYSWCGSAALISIIQILVDLLCLLLIYLRLL